MTQTTRTYPVPSRVSSTCPSRISDNPVFDRACQYAADGRVKGYQLPVLASGSWAEGADWAQSILDREDRAAEAKSRALLASIGWTDASDHPYDYHGVLDSNIEDHEVIVGLIRSAQEQGRELEFWDGMDWGQVQFDDNEDVDFVLLDPDLLASVVDSFKLGIGGVTLSPFRPKAWVPGESEAVEDFFSKLFPDGDYTPVVISVEGDDSNQLVASLGLPCDVDYESVQRATARWARRTDPVCAGGSLRTLRDLLVREGVRTPDFNLEASPGPLGVVSVTRGRDRQVYSIGQPVVASGGVGPDIVYAIVDEMDTSAVLDVIRVSPGPVAYKRQGGKWIKDQPTLVKLLGVNPPPVTELQPDQVDEVIGQVDAYDQANPPKSQGPGPMTASLPVADLGPAPAPARPAPKRHIAKSSSSGGGGAWTEDLHPRAHGKFAKKNGPNNAKPAARPGRRPGDLRGNRPSAAEMANKPWLALGLGNDQNFHDLDMGLGKDFWSKQPPGFRKWLVPFLRGQQNKQDPNWKSQVPAQFAGAMDAFAKAAGSKSEHPGSYDATPGPTKKAAATHKASGPGAGLKGNKQALAQAEAAQNEYDKQAALVNVAKAALGHDHKFDVAFAQEGLGEARRREIFDRQMSGLTDRLRRAGINGRGIAVVIERKIAAEKQRRNAFERSRKNKAEQERIRRLKAKGPASITADASHMPRKLKDYWVAGKGAAKIRWGTSGDFKRCERALAKYLAPEQIAGACASLHHVATGQWPGKGRKH